MRPPHGFPLTSRIHLGAVGGRGFTLIEMLAVIVVLTLVAALGISGLSSTGSAAALMKVIGECRGLDAQARLAARTCGSSVMIKLDADSRRIELIQRDNLAQLSEVSLPADVSVRFEIDGAASDTVMVDRLGKSADYSVVVNYQGHQRRIELAGITGATRTLESEAHP